MSLWDRSFCCTGCVFERAAGCGGLEQAKEGEGSGGGVRLEAIHVRAALLEGDVYCLKEFARSFPVFLKDIPVHCQAALHFARSLEVLLQPKHYSLWVVVFTRCE